MTATDVVGDDGTAIEVRWTTGNATGVAPWSIERTRTAKELRDARVTLAEKAVEAARTSGATPETALAAGERAIAEAGATLEWLVAAVVPAGERSTVVGELSAGESYRFRIRDLGETGDVQAVHDVGMVAWGRIPFGILLVLISATVIACIALARSGVVMRIRRIAALEAIDEAVGRATEMGRPVLFVPGIQDMNDLQTVAGITVLGRVAKVAAEYDAPLEVPTSRSLVMTAARDAVQAAYLSAGRGDAYSADRINYITDEQFGYVAYLAGTMNRERPATCLYMGAFYAESLLLAENGNSIGAIQIAGTAESSQLPFFVAACDYTLIGEEFFAASAYLSGEPMQLGSLFGQDLVKIASIAMIVLGTVLATAAAAGWASAGSGSELLQWLFAAG